MTEVVAALLTPFDGRGRVDGRWLRRHVDLLLDAGVDGLMPAGTTGEGPLLDDDELLELVRATVAAAGGRARVLAHVGRPSTEATVRNARAALDAGADAVSAVVPYYYALADDQVRAHFAALVDACAGTDVYAYTIPERTHNELSPATLRELGTAGLRGVKDSTKSFD